MLHQLKFTTKVAQFPDFTWKSSFQMDVYPVGYMYNILFYFQYFQDTIIQYVLQISSASYLENKWSKINHFMKKILNYNHYKIMNSASYKKSTYCTSDSWYSFVSLRENTNCMKYTSWQAFKPSIHRNALGKRKYSLWSSTLLTPCFTIILS